MEKLAREELNKVIKLSIPNRREEIEEKIISLFPDTEKSLKQLATIL